MTASKRQKFDDNPGMSPSGPRQPKRHPFAIGSAFTAYPSVAHLRSLHSAFSVRQAASA
jgi:hypothetical protein